MFEKEKEFIDHMGGVIKIAKIIDEEENTSQYGEFFQNEKIARSFLKFPGNVCRLNFQKFHWA